MAKVFLSYDHEDSAEAHPLAAALGKAGHDVWFDRQIHGGAQYSQKIEQALDAADAVVVLWSERSIDSAWVRDEAGDGRDRGKLVPLSLASVAPPIGFRQFQTIDLGSWRGRGKVPRLSEILAAVDSHTLEARAGSAEAPTVASPRSSLIASPVTGKRSRRFAMAALALLVLGAGFGAWKWLSPARLPVVQVAAADPLPRSAAAARDLYAKLGSLSAIGQGKWRLIDSNSPSTKPDFLFRTADVGSATAPRANLLLLGQDGGLLWSHEFAFASGGDADLRQQMSLTAGRVLACALETRTDQHFPPDLLKLFLDSCASMADLAGDDYGPVSVQLRQILDRQPRFEPAWRRLLLIQSMATDLADSPDQQRLQLKTDIQRAEAVSADVPELAIARLRFISPADYARRINLLDTAVGRAPDNPQLLLEQSKAYSGVGRISDAIASARRAAEVDPLSPAATGVYIMALATGDRLDAARRELEKAQKLWAGTNTVRDLLIAFHSRYGDPAVALSLDPEGYNTAAYYAARTHPSALNIAKLKRGIDEFRAKSVSPSQVAWATQSLSEFGLVDDVFYWFGKLSNEELASSSYVFFRPAFRPVRADARFMPLAARAGLVRYWQGSRIWPDFCRRPGLPYDCKTAAAKLK